MYTQFIGIDFADENSEDCTVVLTMCENCFGVIESKPYDSQYDSVPVIMYRKCPYCGAKFSKYIIEE